VLATANGRALLQMLLTADAPCKLPVKCEDASELSLKESFPTKISVVPKEPSPQKGSAPTTPRTPSRAASLATQSESLDAKSSSPDTSVSGEASTPPWFWSEVVYLVRACKAKVVRLPSASSCVPVKQRLFIWCQLTIRGLLMHVSWP
jgi:hypothetical protein